MYHFWLYILSHPTFFRCGCCWPGRWWWWPSSWCWSPACAAPSWRMSPPATTRTRSVSGSGRLRTSHANDTVITFFALLPKPVLQRKNKSLNVVWSRRWHICGVLVWLRVIDFLFCLYLGRHLVFAADVSTSIFNLWFPLKKAILISEFYFKMLCGNMGNLVKPFKMRQ